MVEIGVLGEDEPYELIDGELVDVRPQGEPHPKAITRLTIFFAAEYLPRRHAVRVRMPVGGIVDSIPEPDLAIVTRDVAEQEGPTRAGPGDPARRGAVTRRPRDRRKATISSTTRAPEYWIVDVPGQVVIVHIASTRDGSWEQVRTVGVEVRSGCRV